MLEKLAENHL